jgi:hypothetical protein
MLWAHFAGMTAALITIVLATPTQAQQPAPPPFATTKVADNVYIFRYGGHQSMFIVTPDGVIATDPGKQTGTKDNAREELAYLQDLSAAVKQAVSEGKSYADAQKEIKLPKYEAWPNYNAFLPMNIERYYDFWNRGI